MLISDTVMMLSLLGFCVGWLVRRGKPVPTWLWLLAATALAAAAVGVVQGRWQAAIGGCLAIVMLLCLFGRSRRKKTVTRIPLISTLLLLGATAIAYAPLYLLPVFVMPKPTGPHPVGVRTFTLEDSSRTGVMEAEANEPRKILLRAWYPAQQAGESPVPYASSEELEVTFAGLASLFGMPPFFFSHVKLVPSNSYESAAVLTGDTALPVVFFSHGYMSYAAQNSVLMETLASHGYLVIAISHPYDAAPVLFPDGTVIRPPVEALTPPQTEDGEPLIPASQKQFYAGATYNDRFEGMLDYFTELQDEDSRMLRSAEAWLADRLFVSETLAAGGAPANVRDVMERGDFSRVAHIGMSFGGSTAAALGYEDPRCAAAVNLDGGDYHRRSANRPVPVPLLMFHSDWRYFGEIFGDEGIMDLDFGFNDFSYERYAQAGQTENVYRLRVKNVKHIGISDYPLMLREPVSSMLVGSIDPESMMEIINDFVLGFLDRHLRRIGNDFPQAQFADHADDVVPHDASKVRSWWQTKSPDETLELEKRLAGALAL